LEQKVLDAGLGSKYFAVFKKACFKQKFRHKYAKNALFLEKQQKSASALGALRLQPPPPVGIRRLWAPPKVSRVVTHTYYCKLFQRTILALTRVYVAVEKNKSNIQKNVLSLFQICLIFTSNSGIFVGAAKCKNTWTQYIL